jgi:hypothetical protein
MKFLLRLAACLSALIACSAEDRPRSGGDGGAAPEAGVEAGGSGGAGGSGAAGGGGAGGSATGADCDPIGVHCGMPFPSDYYLKADPTGRSPSGKSVRFGATTLPKPNGEQMPAEFLHELDGWSPASGPMTFMPGATATGMAKPDAFESTLLASSPTILLDAVTGELVPHWVDLDESVRNADQKAFMLRPVVLLENERRYVVAIRDVRDASGSALAPTPAFAALRDGADHDDPRVASRRDLYDDIFAKLGAAGVERESLQIAWDFTTGSRRSISERLTEVRDAALAVVGEQGPAFTVKSVEDDAAGGLIKHRILLEVTFPSFLTATEWRAGDPVPRIQRDASGSVQQNGEMTMEVLVQVPNVAQPPFGIVQNGHGLFGTKHEGQGGYMARFASGWGWVHVAIDLFGFSGAEFADLGNALPFAALNGRTELLPGFVDRQIQGMVNQLLVMRMMIGRVATDGIRDPRAADAGAAGDASAPSGYLLAPGDIDASLRAYRGDSQGGIMGGTYMAASTDVTRGLLGEPGTPYSLLLNRSKDWPLYGNVLGGTLPNDLDVQIAIAIIQLFWDRSEPSGFVPFMNGSNTLPNTPEHHVLMHAAIGDHQVTTYGAHIMARAVDARQIRSDDPAQPVFRTLWGIPEVDPPYAGSGYIEYDFALAPEPLTNIPPDDGCDPHDRVRDLTPSYEQQDHFFRTGEIRWYCQGACSCDGPTGNEDRCEETFEAQCR